MMPEIVVFGNLRSFKDSQDLEGGNLKQYFSFIYARDGRSLESAFTGRGFMGSDVDLLEATDMNMNFASSADLFKKNGLLWFWNWTFPLFETFSSFTAGLNQQALFSCSLQRFLVSLFTSAFIRELSDGLLFACGLKILPCALTDSGVFHIWLDKDESGEDK